MTKWYVWCILSGIWIVTAILNALERRYIGYSIFAAVLFAILGVLQYYCDKKGKISKKTMKLIYAAALVLVVLTAIIIISTVTK